MSVKVVWPTDSNILQSLLFPSESLGDLGIKGKVSDFSMSGDSRVVTLSIGEQSSSS